MNHTTQRIYQYILTFCDSHSGNSPTLRQIVDGTGISSTSVVAYHLDILEEHGLLERRDGHLCVTGATWQVEQVAA